MPIWVLSGAANNQFRTYREGSIGSAQSTDNPRDIMGPIDIVALTAYWPALRRASTHMPEDPSRSGRPTPSEKPKVGRPTHGARYSPVFGSEPGIRKTAVVPSSEPHCVDATTNTTAAPNRRMPTQARMMAWPDMMTGSMSRLCPVVLNQPAI